MGFNLDDYEPVADRIERFWKDHPNGFITTELVHHDEKHFIIKAYVKRDAGDPATLADATGYAEEIIGSTNVNRTSALENCETSAIGRALANLGYAVKNRASREEMAKAQPEPRPRSGGRKLTPSPQSSETPPEAPRTNGNGEIATSTTILKRDLLAAVNGDKPKASMIWREVLGEFGYLPDDLVPDDMRSVIGEALLVKVGLAVPK